MRCLYNILSVLLFVIDCTPSEAKGGVLENLKTAKMNYMKINHGCMWLCASAMNIVASIKNNTCKCRVMMFNCTQKYTGCLPQKLLLNLGFAWYAFRCPESNSKVTLWGCKDQPHNRRKEGRKNM